jgi:steroid delta-isomerase-like uncharacterized protein
MSVPANEQVVQRFNDEYINTGDAEVMAEFLAPDCRMYGNGECEADGLAAYAEMLSGFRTAFPDLEHKCDEIMSDGDRVAERFTTRGTHRSEFQGVPPTGKRVEFTGTSIFKLRDGKIVEERTSVDLLALMSQLGVIPVPEEVAG